MVTMNMMKVLMIMNAYDGCDYVGATKDMDSICNDEKYVMVLMMVMVMTMALVD